MAELTYILCAVLSACCACLLFRRQLLDCGPSPGVLRLLAFGVILAGVIDQNRQEK